MEMGCKLRKNERFLKKQESYFAPGLVLEREVCHCRKIVGRENPEWTHEAISCRACLQ